MPRANRPITVIPGDLQQRVEARVNSGAYAFASEVVRPALRALDREEAAPDDWVRQPIEEALVDPRPDVSVGGVFKRLREHHAQAAKAARDEEI
jgi:antitoxin ParD1/3/4